MNRLIQSPSASDPNKQQPLPVASQLFIQDAYKEAISNIVKNTIGSAYSASVMYILYGCVGTGTDPGARTISAGAVFFNGEIYIVPSASFTSTGSNVAVAKITVTNPSPDPILLKDGTSVNVHNVRQVVISAGASGSGDANFSAFVPVNQIPITSVATHSASQSSTGSNVLIAGMTYTTPNDGITRLWYIKYKGQANTVTDGSGNSGANAIMRNTTASTTLDTSGILLTGAAATSTIADSIELEDLVSLAPNTVIEIQISQNTTGGATFSQNRLIVIEQRVN